MMRYMSGATRDIYIGSLELFNREMFPPCDYIALGHYHKRIVSDNLAYSGSPIPLSFDEVNYRKYILDVEISDGEVTIDSIEVPKFRDIFRVKGSIEDIEDALIDISNLDHVRVPFIELTVEPSKELIDVASR